VRGADRSAVSGSLSVMDDRLWYATAICCFLIAMFFVCLILIG
jgi:hypothetical protein